MKKWFTRLLCVLLASVMVVMTPLSGFVDIEQNVSEAEASATVIGPTALLEFLLAGFGVTVSAVALDNLADSFSDWLSDNGSAESLSAWGKASSMSLVTVTAPLLRDVATWIGEKFDSLTSGKVSSADYGTVSFYYNFADAFDQKAFQYALDTLQSDVSSYPYFGVLSKGSSNGSTSYAWRSEYRMCVVSCTSSNGDIYNYFCQMSDSDNPYIAPISTFYRFTVNSDFSKSSKRYTMTKFSGNWLSHSFYVTGPVIWIETPTQVNSDGFYLNDIAPFITRSMGLSPVYDALTSYGNYDSSNVDALKNMILTPSIISAIMSAVKGAVASNKTEDEQGNIVWSDAVAQAVSDAYAAGLADAKAQQPTLEEEAEEEAYKSGILGWLSKIYNAILTIPTAVSEGFQIVSDTFDVTVDIKDLITVIPSNIVSAFQEVFPTTDKVVELITGIPANMVDALAEVFPVADDVREWITSVPAGAVDVGAITDGLTAVKEAVLAIPRTITDAITDVLERLFVPNLSAAESEIALVREKFGWVGDLHDIIEELMFRLEAGEPPTIYLDFTKAEDEKYHGAGKQLAVDFSWYEKYKPTGDLIIGAFLWVVYLWYLFKRLPDLLNGSGMVAHEVDKINSLSSKLNNKKGER